MSRGKRKTPDAVTLGFESDCVTVPVEAVLPVRALSASVKSSRKYRQITASIKEVGLVEPPVVTRSPGQEDTYMLLDGHIRIEVLKDLGIERVECLISTDDEAFTYNKRISRLAPIQEHKMIRKAIERGVSEEKIALALDLNPRSIVRKAKLLDGICEEAVGILKDKPCATAVFEILRKMKAMRQIEAAELMMNANNYSPAYISAILAGTPQAQLVDTKKPKKMKGHHPRGHGPHGARAGPAAGRDHLDPGLLRPGPPAADRHQGISGKAARERQDRPVSDAASAGVSGRISSDHRDDLRPYRPRRNSQSGQD